MHTRFLLLQAISNRVWKAWLKVYLPTLLVRHELHSERRDIEVSSVCLLDHEAFRVAKSPVKYEKVRYVEVKLVPSLDKFEVYKPAKLKYLERHVSSLVAIVLTENQDLEVKIAELSFQNDEKKDEDEDIHDEEEQDVEQEDIDDKKVIQNLPTLPHFGGECKTTELCEHFEVQIA